MLQGLLIKKIMEIVNKKVGKEYQDLRSKIKEIENFWINNNFKISDPQVDNIINN